MWHHIIPLHSDDSFSTYIPINYIDISSWNPSLIKYSTAYDKEKALSDKMDPLSISTAVVTFIGFSGSCAQLLRRVIRDANHAPDEILALSNEISDLNVLLSDLEVTSRAIEQLYISEHSTAISIADAINSQLMKARSILLDLEALGSELFAASPTGKIKFQKYKWIRKKSLVLEMRQDLISIKRSLGLLLASATA